MADGNLTINSATTGYDSDGIDNLVNQIKANVITETSAKMDEGIDKILNAIDNNWTGKSAEDFKENIKVDKNEIKNKLAQLESALVNQFKSIKVAMQQIDYGVVDRRY